MKVVAAGSLHGLPSGHGRATPYSYDMVRTAQEILGASSRGNGDCAATLYRSEVVKVQEEMKGKGMGEGLAKEEDFGVYWVLVHDCLDFVWFELIFKGWLLSTWEGEGHQEQ